jgi:hypothetical protein
LLGKNGHGNLLGPSNQVTRRGLQVDALDHVRVVLLRFNRRLRSGIAINILFLLFKKATHEFCIFTHARGLGACAGPTRTFSSAPHLLRGPQL